MVRQKNMGILRVWQDKAGYLLVARREKERKRKREIPVQY
jgi:hypothetical protein